MVSRAESSPPLNSLPLYPRDRPYFRLCPPSILSHLQIRPPLLAPSLSPSVSLPRRSTDRWCRAGAIWCSLIKDDRLWRRPQNYPSVSTPFMFLSFSFRFSFFFIAEALFLFPSPVLVRHRRRHPRDTTPLGGESEEIEGRRKGTRAANRLRRGTFFIFFFFRRGWCGQRRGGKKNERHKAAAARSCGRRVAWCMKRKSTLNRGERIDRLDLSVNRVRSVMF